VDALPPPRLAYTTVMTVLDKLHEKGLVTRTLQRTGYVYRSRYAAAELHDHMARSLVAGLVDDFGDVALAHFASALDGVDLRRLRQISRKRP
jgi:predicted transcriptional regulator